MIQEWTSKDARKALQTFFENRDPLSLSVEKIASAHSLTNREIQISSVSYLAEVFSAYGMISFCPGLIFTVPSKLLKFASWMSFHRPRFL